MEKSAKTKKEMKPYLKALIKTSVIIIIFISLCALFINYIYDLSIKHPGQGAGMALYPFIFIIPIFPGIVVDLYLRFYITFHEKSKEISEKKLKYIKKLKIIKFLFGIIYMSTLVILYYILKQN